MNKLTTLALAGLVAVAATASASMSRVAGFGAASSFIADVQNIWTLPAVVANYKNSTYIEFGKTTNGFDSGEQWGFDSNQTGSNGTAFLFQDLAPSTPWGGVHMELGPGVLGVWMNRPYHGNDFSATGFQFGTPTNSGIASSSQVTPNQTADILYGYNLSDATTLGLSLSRAVYYGGTKTESPAGTTDNNRDFSDYGIGLGLDQKNLGPIALLEVGLNINMKSQTNTNKNSTVTDKFTRNGSNVAIRVGGDFAGDKGAFGRAELGLAMGGQTIKDEAQTAPPANTYSEAKDSNLNYNLGYAMGKSSDKGMGLAGLMFRSNSFSGDAPWNSGNDSNKVTFSEMRLELSTAGEAKLNNWLAVRAGFASDLFYSYSKVLEVTAGGNTTKTTNSQNERWNAGGPFNYNNLAKATLGTSVTLGDLVIDGVLNQDLLYTGGYLLSGVPGVLSTQVSATWGW